MSHGVYSIPLAGPAAKKESDSAAIRRPVFLLREFLFDADNALVRHVHHAFAARRYELNPLVFVGPSGTGKTALAENLAAQWSDEHGADDSIVVSATDYARAYANAVDTNTLAEMRARFRNCGLLLIDGLHQLVEKTAAQIELLHTIDELVQRSRWVVVTMRHLPTDYKPLLPGLASRLSTGLVVSLSPPSIDVRREMIRRLAQAHRVVMQSESIQVLAERFSSFAQLNSAVARLSLASDHSTDKAIAPDAVNTLANDSDDSAKPNLGGIVQKVARYFNVKKSLLRSSSRRQAVVRARGVAMYLSRQLTNTSLEKIGSFFGDRDHTTVLHACRKTESLLATDQHLRQAVDELLEANHL